MFKSIGGIAAAVLMVATSITAPIGASAQQPGYFASDNVEFISHMPFNVDSAGGALVGDYFYVTSSRALVIYDVSDPVAPVQVGLLPLVQQPYFTEEDPDTNGNILLVATVDGTLNVVDVEDKTNPQIIGTLAGADDHTVTCVLNCKWAYNSGGGIIDLRDPTQPKLAGNWAEGSPAAGGGHDVTEVAPGRIVTSSSPMLYLDARDNPAKPKVLATAGGTGGRYIHGNEWPQNATDKFLLVGGESSGPAACENAEEGSFMTFDATKWQQTGSFTMIDEYNMASGLPTEGAMPTATYCAHWFDPHPTYKNGGLVAMAWYEHGTHFFSVSGTGKIEDVGFFLPAGASTSAEYWLTDEILYSVDYNRGIDILRWTGKLYGGTSTSGGGDPEPEPGGGGSGQKLPGPLVRLRVSDSTPAKGGTVTLRTRLARCAGHQGTDIQLRKRAGRDDRWAVVATKKLDGDCRAAFTQAARSDAQFRTWWSKQHDDHRRGKSEAVTIRPR